SSNIKDLKLAAAYLREHYCAPQILIGHSLGGAAVLAVAGDIPEVRAVATINAPADAAHVVHAFGMSVADIERDGEAEVTLAGRKFKIRKDFLDDVRNQQLANKIASMRRALLIFHAPGDRVVGIENAAEIFTVAKHPKSFVSLDDADHLLTRRADAIYVANVLGSWAARYLDIGAQLEKQNDGEPEGVIVRETGNSKFQQHVVAGKHTLTADEPIQVGGHDSGPSPYDFLAIALGACTSMTLRIYAVHKGLDLGKITVAVTHGKVHANDCEECEGREGRIDRFERKISIEGGWPPEFEAKIVEIANKCPVHRTLEAGAMVATRLVMS
ncbi:MAG: bifunctional alpha/beta hydrolase/OsmC family protein, partial [Usitatibacteraceae bacterium]